MKPSPQPSPSGRGSKMGALSLREREQDGGLLPQGEGARWGPSPSGRAGKMGPFSLREKSKMGPCPSRRRARQARLPRFKGDDQGVFSLRDGCSPGTKSGWLITAERIIIPAEAGIQALLSRVPQDWSPHVRHAEPQVHNPSIVYHSHRLNHIRSDCQRSCPNGMTVGQACCATRR